jgi:hypothetical protein
MRRASSWLTALVSSSVLAAGAMAQVPSPYAAIRQPAPMPPAAVAQPAQPASPEDREVQALLDRLSRVSDTLVRNIQSPQAYHYQVEQADVLLQLAARTHKADERDNWLKMAVDSYYSAAVQSPDSDPAVYQRLVQLPAQIAQSYPGNPLYSYAALREVHADYERALSKAGNDPSKAQELLRQRLLQFAEKYPRVPEAAKAIVDAAALSEKLGKTEDACGCYRYLAEAYAGQPLSRQARAALRRLGGMNGEVVDLSLPQLYAAGAGTEQSFDLKQMRGSLVLVYFWASTCPQAAEGFQALKQLTDRYQYRGLEVVYVNLDGDPAKAREFLSGRLTAGTHVYQPGGMNGAVTERYGLVEVPQIFLLGRDSALLRHSLQPSQLDAALAGHLPRGK